MASPYDTTFFDGIRGSSQRSAEVVVETILGMIHPRSVIDVGCAQGVWLKAFADRGVSDVLGVDGDYVDRAKLAVPADKFRAIDLARPIPLDHRFDLVVCLEVAEHLPASAAKRFIADLARLGDLVLFSAAVPAQGGTGHVNEQWQDYWRDLFAEQKYFACDIIRPRVLGDKRVAWWYQQNIILYGTAEALSKHRLPITESRSLNIVVPDLYSQKVNMPFLFLAAMLPRAFCAAVSRRFRRLSGKAKGRRASVVE